MLYSRLLSYRIALLCHRVHSTPKIPRGLNRPAMLFQNGGSRISGGLLNRAPTGINHSDYGCMHCRSRRYCGWTKSCTTFTCQLATNPRAQCLTLVRNLRMAAVLHHLDAHGCQAGFRIRSKRGLNLGWCKISFIHRIPKGPCRYTVCTGLQGVTIS